ncbi:MAG: sporulation protein YunB [Ruminococcus sp.]|nr:sporulation protein YunB [Ruminococcus sp.]
MIFAVIVILLIIVIIKAERAVRPVAAIQAEHLARSSANELIGCAVADYLSSERFTYSDFAAVLYDENGKAVSVEAVPCNINRVQSELTVRVNRALSDVNTRTERIPIGSLTGSAMLVGKGPSLKVRICPSGSAQVSLRSDFSSAGVNQTRHRISAVVEAELISSVPLYSFSTKVSFEFLLAESIIVGDVPALSRYAWSSL